MGITTTGDHLGDSADGGYVTPDPSIYNAVADEREHEVDTGTLNPKEAPRHDKYAAENGAGGAERVEPYTASGANPSYPEDRQSGIVEPDPDVEPQLNEVVDVTADAREVLENGEGGEPGERLTVEPPFPDIVEALGEGELPLDVAVEAPQAPSNLPAGNASGEEWRAYAVGNGMDPAEADSLSRDELRAEYGWVAED